MESGRRCGAAAARYAFLLVVTKFRHVMDARGTNLLRWARLDRLSFANRLRGHFLLFPGRCFLLHEQTTLLVTS